MKLSQLYIWPNFSNCNELAEQFYEKATARMDAFPFNRAFAFSLCVNPDGDRLVHLFIDSDSDVDDSIEVHNTVQGFLMASGCPEQQCIEGAYWLRPLSIQNIPENLGRARIKILRTQSGSLKAAAIPSASVTKPPTDSTGFQLGATVPIKQDGRDVFQKIALVVDLPKTWRLEETDYDEYPDRLISRSTYTFLSGPKRVVQATIEGHPFGWVFNPSPKQLYDAQVKAMRRRFWVRKLEGEFSPTGGGACEKNLKTYLNYDMTALVNEQPSSAWSKVVAVLRRVQPQQIVRASSLVLYCFQFPILSFSSIEQKAAIQNDHEVMDGLLRDAIQRWAKTHCSNA
jgi:hypothetical protein